MRPFLKWAGSKYKIIDRVRAELPPGARLIEPFLGSGAVFLNTSYNRYLLADSNPDLINLFQVLQTCGAQFIQETAKLFTPENNAELTYYSLREEFNSTVDVARKSSLFIYLNRHSFNGLCRYNKSGKFNVPFGRYKNPGCPTLEMQHFMEKSRGVEFLYSGFVETMEQAVPGDVVYCDPPYAPLTATANFSSYTLDGFGMEEQQQLAQMACKLVARGIPVVISNHDTLFTRDVYAQARIESFGVQRFIAASAKNRCKVSELIAVFA